MSRQLFLFGHLRTFSDGQPLSLGGNKRRGLLAYLALFPDANTSRERLADLFWPELPPRRSRHQLSNLLYQVRQELGEGWLLQEGEQVKLDRTDLEIDVQQFDRLVKGGEQELFQAIELYRGDLLLDLYDEWLTQPRYERREAYLSALARLVQAEQEQENLAAALRHAHLLVSSEPLREENQQAYLRLLGRMGRRSEAVQHYQKLQRLLKAELGVDPLPETRRIAASIQRESQFERRGGQEDTPFVGREAERRRLIDRLESCSQGRGGVAVVEAEAGMGKSRLLRETAASARWRGILVLEGAAGEQETDPLAPLALALEALPSPRLHAVAIELPPAQRQACARLIPAWKQPAELPEMPAEPQQERLSAALLALFRSLLRQGPLCLLLDELHYSQPELWLVVEKLAQLAVEAGLLLVLAYRRSMLEGRSGWSSLKALESRGLLEVLSLEQLSEWEARLMIPGQYAREAERIYSLAGGNPLWLLEAVSALEEGGLPQGKAASLSVQRCRLSLPESCCQALSAAAVLGMQVEWPLWAGVASQEDLVEHAARLVQHRFLYVTGQGYAFRHELVQQAFYQQLTEGRRQELHRAAAAELERWAPDRLAERAWHLDRGGEAGEAVRLYRMVAADQVQQGALAAGQQALERALELAAQDTPMKLELLLDLGRMKLIMDERAAQPLAAAALELSLLLGDERSQAQASLLCAEQALKSSDYLGADRYLASAFHLAERLEDGGLQGEVLNLMGEVALRQGEFEQARQLYARLLSLGGIRADRAQEAAAFEGLGFTLGNMGGEAGEALDSLRKAVEIRRQTGNRYKEAQALHNLVSALQAAGRLDEALGLGEEALRLNQEIGYARGAAIVQASLALAAMALGDLDRAREEINSAREYFQQVDDPTAVGLYSDTLGLVYARSGKVGQAEELYLQAVSTLDACQAEFFAALARLDLGGLLVRQGRPEEALVVLERAAEVFAQSGARLELLHCRALHGWALADCGRMAGALQAAGECLAALRQGWPEGEERQYSLWALWKLLERLEMRGEAQEALGEAFATLRRQANLLADPGMRRAYLSRVQTNREIADAWGERGEEPDGAGSAMDEQARRGEPLAQRLVRADIPLGRPLVEQDFVAVRWTPAAPEDSLLEDKGERRRAAICRMLGEAASQGAAPTDEDLAAALGVSRRTILRDMETLASQGVFLPTRKRKGEAGGKNKMSQ
jgi:DNA-binding SARP family transcriptional activator/predicted ATPase